LPVLKIIYFITDVVGEEETKRVLPDGVDPSVAGEVNGDPKPSSGRAF
jgi:hypothetical protein